MSDLAPYRKKFADPYSEIEKFFCFTLSNCLVVCQCLDSTVYAVNMLLSVFELSN